jgi:hypothetical protein
MDHTGCHQLNRVLTHNNNVSEKWYPTLLAGQPEIVLRTTGPTTVFIIELSRVCDSWSLPFVTAMAWVGIWSSLFMVLIALTVGAVQVEYC